MNYVDDTIAAISTGSVTSAGIGIIRMSGSNAIEIADKIFVSKKNSKKLKDVPTHTIHYGNIHDQDNIIDEVLVSVMRGPNSYTKEDIVEINCHGGLIVMKKILDLCFCHGARPAEPGEFTKRAFLNGRMDLSQAEAVIDLINSQNDLALRSSVNQLRGCFSDKIHEMREQLLHYTAFIEAALDDPEHISLDGFSDELAVNLNKIMEQLEYYIETSENGRVIKDGINTVILGKPNAGKSSLLNALARYERAIVTDIPGTTRDIIEERVHLKGLILNLMDTAGIRDTSDKVEAIGVEKSMECAKNADLVMYVVDSSRPLDQNDEDIIRLIKNQKVVIILNKSDLAPVVDEIAIRKYINAPIIRTSAKNMDGIDVLEDKINALFLDGKIQANEELLIANLRQKNSLKDALKSLKLVISSIESGMSEDFYTLDLMNAYEELGKITGESVDEDLANEIFAKFCMGK
ncbi:MAG: tRNA uridine-5-carboxymethylaminomethyl(34) synthesis GTPase MnmE [Lachnospiraceae bacterium]